MRNRIRLSLFAFCLAFGGAVHASPLPCPESTFLAGDKWIADENDNICGIKDLKKVSHPAVIDYDALWEATPQIKKMKDKKIDPESTEGKALRSEAKTLITKTCESLRSDKGYCGVWKAIKNEDGRKVADITDDVKAKFDDSTIVGRRDDG